MKEKIWQGKNKVGLKLEIMTQILARASISMMVDREPN